MNSKIMMGGFCMKLNYKRTFFVGLAFLSISAFWQMYDNIVPLILQNTFRLNESVIGALMAVDNVLAVFLLPIIGTFSDKVDTRLGKRTPFIICGTFVAVCLMMLLPYADRSQNLWLFVIALGLTLFAMATYRSPMQNRQYVLKRPCCKRKSSEKLCQNGHQRKEGLVYGNSSGIADYPDCLFISYYAADGKG